MTNPESRIAYGAPIAVRVIDAREPVAEDIQLGKADDGRAYTALFVIATDGFTPRETFVLPATIGTVPAAAINAELKKVEIPITSGPSEGPEPKISVIIGVTDGGKRLTRAIESIFAGGYKNAEIVAVNNRPAEGPIELDPDSFVSSDPRVVLVDQPKPGLSAARNGGAAVATGEILLFTDDDIVAMPGLLHAIAGAFAQNPNASCVTGLILPLKLETETQVRIELFAGFAKGFEQRKFTLEEYKDDRIFPFAAGLFGSGANIAVTREAFEKLGGFDEALGTGTPARGGEDTDIFIRLMLCGHELVYEPASAVLHEHPSSQAQLRNMVYNYGVGTTSVIAKQFFIGTHRRRLLRALPAGLVLALSPRSEKNQRKGETFPVSYTLRELAGMAGGPLAYVKSRRADHDLPPAIAGAFEPAYIGEIELSKPLKTIGPTPAPNGAPFTRARLLARVGGAPVGFVDVPLHGGKITPAKLAIAAQEQIGEQIASELADRSAPEQTLTRSGIDLNGSAGPAPTPPDAPLVSVVVCTRDHPEQFERTMDSVLDISYPNFELIVIDNAPSNDAVEQLVKERDDARVHYFLEPVAGLSRARNRGLLEADGEFIAFTDDDVEVDRDWLQGLLEGFETGKKVGLVTGIVVSTRLDNEFQQYFDENVQWSDSFKSRLFDLKKNKPDHLMYPYASGMIGTGANFAMRADAVKAVGPFDEALGAGMPTRGGEDLDYFLRMLSTDGWQIAYEPDSLVWHDHRSDADALKSQMFGYGSGAMAYGFKAALHPQHTGRILVRLARLLSHRLRGDRAYSFETGHGELRNIQRSGLVRGPWLYIKSRLQIRGRAPAKRIRKPR
jgi:GT2 family glycosyltransferase